VTQNCYIVVFKLFFEDFAVNRLINMKDSKLIKILRTFSPEERTSFEKFIASPYFNTVKNYLSLFKELIKFYPDFNDDKLKHEYIYKKLFKSKPFNKQVMWNLKSGLEKLAKEFLEQVALGKNKFERMELLVTEFGNRKLLKDYSHTLNEMEKLLETNAIDSKYFENRENLETYKQVYYFLINKVQSMSDSKLKAAEYQILLFLRMTVGGLNDMSVLTKDYNSTFEVNIPMEFVRHIDLKSIVDYARSKKFEYAFLIEIYYHSLMMLLEPGETGHLNKARKLYKMHYDKFNLGEKRTIMHWILIYCILRTESEGIKYERIIFELNKFRLKEGLAFYPKGQLHKEIFYQILSVALSIGKTKWAENFIKNYTSKLQPEIQKFTEAMAYAYLHFQKKEYEKVLRDLNNVEYFDIWDKLYAKSLLAKTYYEMNIFDSLLNHIDSAKHFLKTNISVSELYAKYYGNFYYFLTRLISVYENADLHLISVLKKEILSTIKLDNKNWLLEKANELEKIKS
jgi:hypothetical protein